MKFARADNVTVKIPRAAVDVIFNECDRYDVDETGGRILGTFESSGEDLLISVTGVIEPGPNAQRTQTYFKQDGAYQEQVFRAVEDHVPATEHLGNWHTHHVNGLRHLSGGDIQTYRRTVEHHNHNIDFWYALLVTERVGRSGPERYLFKNYLMRRGDERVYEIPTRAVSLVDSPLVWPRSEPFVPTRKHLPERQSVTNADLVHDQKVISQFYPSVKTLQSKDLGIYWRGMITLADGSEQEVIVLRDADAPFSCSVNLRNPADALEPVQKALTRIQFSNTPAALIGAERACNAQLVNSQSHQRKRRRLWTF